MAPSGALTLALALALTAGEDRLLLCRPKIAGDPALARADAVAEAIRGDARFLDYGVVCESAAEGARAARRMGLAHAVSSTAEGRVAGSRYLLVLAEAASEAARAERAVAVAPGDDALRPLRAALSELLWSLPPPPRAGPSRAGAWSVAGTGVVALAAGAALAASSRDAAERAGAASDPAAYTRARGEWRARRTASGVLLGAGGAALAAGVTWRLAFDLPGSGGRGEPRP
jgi:hypothetical protein